MAVINAKEDQFQKLIQNGVSLVMFHAPWCESCRRIKPTLLRVESQLPFIQLILVDVEECAGIAAKYEVEVVPAIYICKDGKLEALAASLKIADIRRTVAEKLYGEKI